MRRLLHLFTLLFLAVALAAPAQQTLLVPQDFPTVQAALDASASGDTVLVAPGTYVENLTLAGKSLTLQSSGGAGSTVLDGGEHGPVLSIAGSATAGTVVSGFTVQRGLAIASSHGAAGIALSDTAATLASNHLLNNSGDNIGVFFGAATVRDSTLSTAPTTFGNGCDGGGGITVIGSSTVHDAAGNSVPLVIVGNRIAGDSTACSGVGIALTTDSFTVAHLVSNNVVRDSLLGLRLAVADGILLRQNLIFDNLRGAAILSAAATPSTGPAQTIFANNTVVNNLNAPDPADAAPAEIHLIGTAATTAFLNNILVGTTAHPVLLCDAATPTLNNTPLLLDHTDVSNTTGAPGGLLAGDCTPGVNTPLTRFGNLSADPALAGSTDLHLTAGSPAIDAGLNAAPLSATDLDGAPRVVDGTARGFGTVDLGAYEFSGTADSATATVALTPSTWTTPAATITLTATVSGPSGNSTPPPGSLTFVQNGATLATVRPDSTGVATLDVPLTTQGLYALSASFTPDAAAPPVAPTGSPVVFIDVTSTAASTTTPTALTLTPSATVLTTAETLVLQLHLATVPGSSTVPPGSVTLADNGVPLRVITPNSATGDVSVSLNLAAPGSHAISAIYPGSASFGGSSASATVTVNALLPTTLSLSSAPAHPTPGQTVALTAQLGSTAASGSAGPVPPGAISLYDGTVLLTSLQPDSAGVVTYSLPASTSTGSHTFAVRYAGTTVYGSSASSITVTLPAPAATTLSLTASSGSAFPGVTVSLTATVANTAAPGTPPTGTVTFTDGAAALGTVPVAAGTAALSVTTLALGTHTITAAYAPDPAFAAAHASASVVIAGVPTTLGLASSLNPVSPPFPQSGTFSLLATVANAPAPALLAPGQAAPTGTIAVTDSTTSTSLGSLAVTPTPGATTSTATFSLSLPPGNHTLVATFQPASPSLLTSTATLVEVVTRPDTPALSLVASPNPAFSTDAVALTVTLANAPAQTTVQLRDGASPFATEPVLQASGRLTLSTAANQFAPGDHTLSATLLSGADVLATSPPILLHMKGLESVLTLSASPSPSVPAASPVTLTAAVSAPIAPGHILSGPVTFRDGATVLGVAPLDATGHASFTLASLAPGTHLLLAVYAGDSLVGPATSPTLTETATLIPTTLTLASSIATTTAFQPVLLTALVTAAGSPTPPGTAVCTPACVPTVVTFSSGATVLGISPIDSSGRATLALAPHAGTLVITASFSGSPLFLPSSSPAPVTLTVARAPTVLTLSASPDPMFQNDATTLTARLLASLPSSASLPALGSPITFSEQTADGPVTLGTLATAAGTLPFSPVSPGQLTLSADFPGSADLAPAQASTTLTVLPSELTLAVHDTALTIQTTQHATTSLTLVATGNMADTIDFACPDAPYVLTCTFSPASMAVTGDGSAHTIAVAIDTDFMLDWAHLGPPARRPGNPSPGPVTLAATGASCLALAALTLVRALRRHPGADGRQPLNPLRLRRPFPGLLAVLLALSAGALSSCSGRQPGHTPPGTYTLVFSAHAREHNLTRTTRLKLTVTP